MGKNILSLFLFVSIFFILQNTNAAARSVGCPVSSIEFKCNAINATECVTGTESDARIYCTRKGKTYWDLSNVKDYKNANAAYSGTFMCSGSPSKNSLSDICSTQPTAPIVENPVDKCQAVGAEVRTGGSDSNPSYVCFCSNTGEQFYPSEIGSKGKKCNQAISTSGVPELRNLETCLDQLKSYASSCGSKAVEASTKCDQTDKSNKEIDEAKSALSQTTQMMSMFKAGSGAVKDCLTAGAAALASKTAMDGLKEQCDERESVCNSSCDTNTYDQKVKECNSYSRVSSTYQSQANELIKQVTEEAKANFQAGIKTCQVAKKKQSDMGNLLNDLQRTIQSGAMCACQFSAGGAGCNNPTQANNILGVCAVGTASYNAQACECQMNGNSGEANGKAITT